MYSVIYRLFDKRNNTTIYIGKHTGKNKYTRINSHFNTTKVLIKYIEEKKLKIVERDFYFRIQHLENINTHTSIAHCNLYLEDEKYTLIHPNKINRKQIYTINYAMAYLGIDNIGYEIVDCCEGEYDLGNLENYYISYYGRICKEEKGATLYNKALPFDYEYGEHSKLIKMSESKRKKYCLKQINIYKGFIND